MHAFYMHEQFGSKWHALGRISIEEGFKSILKA